MKHYLHKIKRIKRDRRGATAVEAAFVLPVVIALLLGTMQMAMAFYDISMTKNSLDESVRKIVLLQGPSNADVTQIVADNIYQSGNSTILTTTAFETKYGSDYVNITASISYAMSIPFVSDLTIDKDLTSTIVINR